MTSRELTLTAEGKCEQHRADHSFRVMVLAREIFEKQLEIDGPEEIKQSPDIYLQVLDWAAVLHDREMTGRDDFEHGQKAANLVDQKVGDKVDALGKDLIKSLCRLHVLDVNEISGLTETQLWLLRVFKDADSLDRVRFDNGDTLNENYLRFESAKKLVPAAKELWEKTKQGFENTQSAFDRVIQAAVEMGLVNRQ